MENPSTLITPRLLLSNHLFPQRNLLNLRIFLPGSQSLSPHPLLQLFVWNISFCSKVNFHIFFELDAQSSTLIIRGQLVP